MPPQFLQLLQQLFARLQQAQQFSPQGQPFGDNMESGGLVPDRFGRLGGPPGEYGVFRDANGNIVNVPPRPDLDMSGRFAPGTTASSRLAGMFAQPWWAPSPSGSIGPNAMNGNAMYSGTNVYNPQSSQPAQPYMETTMPMQMQRPMPNLWQGVGGNVQAPGMAVRSSAPMSPVMAGRRPMGMAAGLPVPPPAEPETRLYDPATAGISLRRR